MKARNREFDLPEFTAFCLVGETVKDGEALLKEKLERAAAIKEQAAKQTDLFSTQETKL